MPKPLPTTTGPRVIVAGWKRPNGASASTTVPSGFGRWSLSVSPAASKSSTGGTCCSTSGRSATAALGPNSSEAAAWVNAQKAALARSQLHLFFRRILRLYPNPAEAPPEVKQAVAYLWKNRRRMNYAAYRKTGFPISSGAVESAAKTLIQQRMKQAGMRWSRDGAQAMLSLRTRLLSQRWHKSLSEPPSPQFWNAPPNERVQSQYWGCPEEWAADPSVTPQR